MEALWGWVMLTCSGGLPSQLVLLQDASLLNHSSRNGGRAVHIIIGTL